MNPIVRYMQAGDLRPHRHGFYLLRDEYLQQWVRVTGNSITNLHSAEQRNKLQDEDAVFKLILDAYVELYQRLLYTHF